MLCQKLYAARVLNIFICCFDFHRYCQKSIAAYLLPLFIMIMSKIQERFTPLLPILTANIRKYDNRKDLERAVFDQKLNLAIIEKSPVACLSDFKHSVQACFSRKEDFACNPFNKMKSDYYTVSEKTWISFNADIKYVQDPKDFPTPYEPYFHFRDNYKEYIEDRPNLKYRCECESVTVYSWSVRVVNIAQSGYYGIILHVLDSKRKGDRFVQNLANISSILYEHQLQTKMQSFRLADLRKNHKMAKDNKAPFSLFYYCKESELHSEHKRRPNNIIVLDTEQKFITHNANCPTKLICFGQIEGIGCLKNPVKSADINWEKIRALHSHNIDIFFNHLKSESLKAKEKDKNEPMLWSSESQSQDQFRSHHSDDDEGAEIDIDAESQQSNEDPLRNLYIKKFADLSLNQ